MRTRSAVQTAQPGAIAICGGLNMDLIYETDRMPDLTESLDAKSLTYCPGGKGANTAIAVYRASHRKPASLEAVPTASKWDAKARASVVSAVNFSDDGGRDVMVFINGAVGDDAFGQQLRDELDQHGIDVSGLQTASGHRSGTCSVFVESDSQESRNIGFQGANLQWKPPNSKSVACLAGGHLPSLLVMHLGIKREEVEKTLILAGEEGIDTLLNPSPAYYVISEVYKNLTHLVLNETECAVLIGCDVNKLDNAAAWDKAVKQFVGDGVKNVVLTLGEKGAYYATKDGKSGLIEAEKDIMVADTTGAGDTFVGVYTTEYVRMKADDRWDIEMAIRRACKAAAKTIQQLGAQEAIPWSDEIDDKI